MNFLSDFEKIRLNVLSGIFRDFVFIEQKKEFITWCKNPKGCNGKHHKRKLQINIEKNFFHCWVCHDSSHVIKLLHKYATASQKKRYIETLQDFFEEGDQPNQIVSLPEDYIFLLDCLHDPLANLAYQWVKENCKIQDETIFQQKIGFCPSGEYKNRIIFPSYGFEGLNYFVTRSIFDNASFKYLDCSAKKSQIIFNEILIDWNNPLVLVEGVKSYMRHIQIPNIVPLLGSRLQKNYRLFRESILNDVSEIYIALDHQAIVESYEIMESYYSFGVDIKILDLSDVNQPDKLDTETFVDRMIYAKPFTKKDKIITKLRNVA